MCQEPTREEVEWAIQRMKKNRAPGEHNIVTELIKYGEVGIVEAVHELIQLI